MHEFFLAYGEDTDFTEMKLPYVVRSVVKVGILLILR
jgi:hypothetical protein